MGRAGAARKLASAAAYGGGGLSAGPGQPASRAAFAGPIGAGSTASRRPRRAAATTHAMCCRRSPGDPGYEGSFRGGNDYPAGGNPALGPRRRPRRSTARLKRSSRRQR